MSVSPEKLQQVLADFEWLTDRSERAEYLIQWADQFVPVPDDIAMRPFPLEKHIDFCESDAYVWAIPQDDATLKFHFAVENPQGLSAMALATILEQTLSGQPLEQVAQVSDEIVFNIFGKNVSMGKGQGLMGLVSRVRYEAQQQLKARGG
ncbi:SufE family protein [Chloroflexota bacterium]